MGTLAFLAMHVVGGALDCGGKMPNGRKDLSACEETKDVFGQQASVALIYLEVYQ